MESHGMLTKEKNKDEWTSIVWTLIVGTGITRGIFFMAYPFLAIHLQNSLGADVATIGWVLGVGPLLGTVVGFYGGYLSDLLGRRQILFWSLMVWGGCLLGFGAATSLMAFSVLNGLNGVCRAVAEPVMQAMISDELQGEAKTKAFHYRYFAVNVGAAVGPALGGLILVSHPTLGFMLAGFSLLIFAIVCRLATVKTVSLQQQDGALTVPNFSEALRILAKDRALLYFVSAAVLCSLAYAQLESTLPLILNMQFNQAKDGYDGAFLYGIILAVNAATIVLFQLPLNRWTRKIAVAKTVAASCIVFAVGFWGFGFSALSPSGYILSMIILSFGEVLVFSNGFILIDKLAPEKLRGTYHSAANLFSIGFAVGPPLGAWFYAKNGQLMLFLASGALLLIAALLYLRGDAHSISVGTSSH